VAERALQLTGDLRFIEHTVHTLNFSPRYHGHLVPSGVCSVDPADPNDLETVIVPGLSECEGGNPLPPGRQVPSTPTPWA